MKPVVSIMMEKLAISTYSVCNSLRNVFIYKVLSDDTHECVGVEAAPR